MLKINKKTENEKTVLELQGRLDTNTAPEIEKLLGETLGQTNDLTFDFNDLEYISSAGLRVLLSAQKSLNSTQGKMKVINVNEGVMDIFEVTGFSDIFTIE